MHTHTLDVVCSLIFYILLLCSHHLWSLNTFTRTSVDIFGKVPGLKQNTSLGSQMEGLKTSCCLNLNFHPWAVVFQNLLSLAPADKVAVIPHDLLWCLIVSPGWCFIFKWKMRYRLTFSLLCCSCSEFCMWRGTRRSDFKIMVACCQHRRYKSKKNITFQEAFSFLNYFACDPQIGILNSWNRKLDWSDLIKWHYDSFKFLLVLPYQRKKCISTECIFYFSRVINSVHVLR